MFPDGRNHAGPGAAHADRRLLPWHQPPPDLVAPPLLVPLPLPGAWINGAGHHLQPPFIASETAAAFGDGAPPPASRDGGAGAHFEAAAAPAFIDFLGVGAT